MNFNIFLKIPKRYMCCIRKQKYLFKDRFIFNKNISKKKDQNFNYYDTFQFRIHSFKCFQKKIKK